jgi:membrane-bound serine protease (ClpP class)
MHGCLAAVTGILVLVGAALILAAASGANYFGIGAQLMIATAIILLVTAAITAWLLHAAVKAQYKRVKTGKEALIGTQGTATTELNPRGEIRVSGEFWQAKTEDDSTIANGAEVTVVDMDGMFLVVKSDKEKA